MSRVADTSFLLTLFDADDPRRETAKAWAAKADPIAVPPEVLGETLGVAHARQGYGAAREILAWLQQKPHIELLETTDVGEIDRTFTEGRGRLSWVDAAVVVRCLADEADPLCFDPDIEAAATTDG